MVEHIQGMYDSQVSQSPITEDWGLRNVRNWEVKTVVLPKKCFITGQKIGILEKCYTGYRDWETDRKSTRLNSSHITRSRMPSSA